MGLADWWLSRSNEAASEKTKLSSPSSPASSSASTSSSSLFKWPLKRAKSEPRKTQQQHHAQLKLRAVANAVAAFKLPVSPRSPRCQPPSPFPEPIETTESTLSCRLMNLRGLSAGVNQAKDLLQQCASVVSLYPSLVQLTVPCAATTCKTDEFAASPTKYSSKQQQPVSETTTLPFWIASEPLLQFENRIQSLVAKSSLQTRLTSDGCGGVYFLHDATESDTMAAPCGIFKPRDEEYMAPKNPRGYVKENAIVGETEHPVNKGFRVGNGALRERAAFLLDELYGNFSGVPMTSLLTLPLADGEIKEGSVQAFVASECSAEDMGPLKFSVPEVHKVGILDVRLFNTDRHSGNILLHKSSPHSATYEMTPIDHGFCLPSIRHLDNATFDWLHWPQAQFPFTGAELDHIASLDAARDASVLRSLGIEEECISTMRICTALLQEGADAGFSLFEIGSHLQRDGDFSQPSTLETLVADALEKVTAEKVEDDSVAFADALVEEAARAVQLLFADQQPKKKVRSISCFS